MALADKESNKLKGEVALCQFKRKRPKENLLDMAFLLTSLYHIFDSLSFFSIESKRRSINIKSLPLTIMATQIELLSSYLSHFKFGSLQKKQFLLSKFPNYC